MPFELVVPKKRRKPLSQRLPAPIPRVRGKLPLWTLKFAGWLASAPYVVTKDEQVKVANAIANENLRPNQRPTTVTWAHVRRLRQRADWQEVVRKFEEGGMEAARQQLISDLPVYIEMHRQGAEMAVRQGDYRAIPQYTVPAIERAYPKRAEAVAPTQVAIVISAEQLKGFKEYAAPEVVVEALLPQGTEDVVD